MHSLSGVRAFCRTVYMHSTWCSLSNCVSASYYIHMMREQRIPSVNAVTRPIQTSMPRGERRSPRRKHFPKRTCTKYGAKLCHNSKSSASYVNYIRQMTVYEVWCEIKTAIHIWHVWGEYFLKKECKFKFATWIILGWLLSMCCSRTAKYMYWAVQPEFQFEGLNSGSMGQKNPNAVCGASGGSLRTKSAKAGIWRVRRSWQIMFTIYGVKYVIKEIHMSKFNTVHEPTAAAVTAASRPNRWAFGQLSLAMRSRVSSIQVGSSFWCIERRMHGHAVPCYTNCLTIQDVPPIRCPLDAYTISCVLPN